MINHCQNGSNRRAWLRTLGWQVRPTLRRFLRRALRAAKPPVTFIGKWLCIGALTAIGFLLMLVLIAEAARHDPLTTKQPVSAPAKAKMQQLRRST